MSRNPKYKEGDLVILKPQPGSKKKRKGRIRYIGPVEGKPKEFYYGVALHEASGKHNGTFEDKKYFDCSANHVHLTFEGDGFSDLPVLMSLENPIEHWSDRNRRSQYSIQASDLLLGQEWGLSPSTKVTKVSSLDDCIKKLDKDPEFLYKKQEKPPCRGLVNFGNTCYFNAVLQCLLQVKELKRVLLNS